MIQSCWAAVGARSREIAGSAKLSTVLSTETSSTGSMSTASATHARRGARGARPGVDARGGVRRALDRLGRGLRGVRHLGFHYFTVQPV